MIDPSVVEDIVKEVLRKIDISNAPLTPNLLVISKPELNIDHELRFLQSYWQVTEANQQESFAFSHTDQAVFLKITQDTLVKTALGLTDSHESQWLSQLIYHEIPISFVLDPPLQQLLQLDENTHRYGGYIKKLRMYKESIENFGILFQRLEELKPYTSALGHNEIEQNHVTKKLITQEDISSLSGNLLVVPKGTIVTPLAKDKARECGIEISFS